MSGEGKAEVHPVSVEVRERDGVVVLAFDKAVSWIGIDPVQAIRVAEQMRTAAVGLLRNTPKTKGA